MTQRQPDGTRCLRIHPLPIFANHLKIGIVALTVVEVRPTLAFTYRYLIGKVFTMKQQTPVRNDTAIAPVLLTPSLVEKMLVRRQAVQVAKFRTTCTDCLPNY